MPPKPCTHSRRAGSDRSWMLGLEEVLLSSRVLKSLGMVGGTAVVFAAEIAAVLAGLHSKPSCTLAEPAVPEGHGLRWPA
ncbi:MAG: hypothetical protein EBV28_06560 [Betaproteobacteria bacterium]|nr:hypothetical protein [Betaproteobacteria bacterium]